MKQFYFYESYAKPICKLTNEEVGQVVKAICGYVFDDKEPSEKTLTKAKALFYLLQEQLTEEKSKEKATAKRNAKHFVLPLSYAKFLQALDDEEAGILIRQCCNFMFGTPPVTDEEAERIDGYFELIKPSFEKSKRQSENAKRHNKKRKKQPVTLAKIRTDFPEIRGNLNAENPILNGVDLDKLYAFIAENGDVRAEQMYEIVELFRFQNSL